MIKFRLATHTETGGPMVEVWRDDIFVAGIYGHEKGVRLVSKYFDGVEHEPNYPPGKPYIKLARRNYWERVKDYDPDKPFGVIQETLGRGTFKLVGYFSPEEDVDGMFPLIKDRLLQATKEWLDKGWITKEEIEEVLR